MKNLVVCSDGTWNKESKKEATNVLKMYYMLAANDEKQVSYYHAGVGTGNRWDKIIGGVTGKGIIQNVFQGYNFIARNYEKGDKIFLFGFSRGAYTARSISGMLSTAGLPQLSRCSKYAALKFKTCADNYVDQNYWCPDCTRNQKLLAEVNDAYAKYKPIAAAALAKSKRNGKEALPPFMLADIKIADDSPHIEMIGVWDTVGSLGIPVAGNFLLRWATEWSRRKYRFLNYELNDLVHYGYHALAIDEKREAFVPALWEEVKKKKYQHIEQVWFAGVHSNIGGSYPDQSLSDVTLKWMLGKAENQGVLFNSTSHVTVAPDPLGRIDESYQSFYKLQPPVHRPIGENAFISEAALHRHAIYMNYQPVNLPKRFRLAV